MFVLGHMYLILYQTDLPVTFYAPLKIMSNFTAALCLYASHQLQQRLQL